MPTPGNIIDQLRRDEGVRNFPYTDTTGHITIGVGRNLTVVGISDPEIEVLLVDDVQSVIRILEARLPYFSALDPVRQGVLINMTFNLGFDGLEGFRGMLTAVARGDWEAAAAAMLESEWAKQVGDRATRLAQQMTTGEWT